MAARRSIFISLLVAITTIISSSTAMTTTMSTRRVAIVGGGITGASVASTLAKLDSGNNIEIHVFDQGRSGVGGRTSHRITESDDNKLRWDHGCQFFRADTPKFNALVRQEWIANKKIAAEWDGTFVGEDGARDFFGLPSLPPFYVGTDGIKSIAHSLLFDTDSTNSITVHEGQRVANMARDDATNKWTLFGTTGEAAFHDSSEDAAKAAEESALAGTTTFDAVVLTDISSSFDSWHRASAGVPPAFSKRVRDRAGARVPLFTCMIAFEHDVPIKTSAATLNDPDLWFVSRTKSKAGLEGTAKDCWTLVSTPEYAMRTIEETPMQDEKTGAFIPQSPDYLTTVPGPELEAAFRRVVLEGRLGDCNAEALPKTVFLNAQRWGSALPASRNLDIGTSTTRKIISGVAYDSHAAPLSPTAIDDSNKKSFVADEEQMLFQAGDMVATCYTPGFEGAALSGMEAAEHIHALLSSSSSSQ